MFEKLRIIWKAIEGMLLGLAIGTVILLILFLVLFFFSINIVTNLK